VFNSFLVDLPVPLSLNISWRLGSALGLILAIQIVTGLCLALHYTTEVRAAFNSIVRIQYHVNLGWGVRLAHANGASLFFILIYLHVLRNMWYGSYRNSVTWVVGVILLLLRIITAFIGYVLPWGQISYWGATVITNLIGAVPNFGPNLLLWVWGGFSVAGPTLVRFFAFHYLCPFILLVLVISHLLALHRGGSSNPLGITSRVRKISFHPYFSRKDFIGFGWMGLSLVLLTFLYPHFLLDPDNFFLADSLVTPAHIQPEWYFLFAYTVLRRIPNRLGGVITMAMAILSLLFMSFTARRSYRGSIFYPVRRALNRILIFILVSLTWLGIKVADWPYSFLGECCTGVYFVLLLLAYIRTY